MVRKGMLYTAILVGLYLGVANATGAGRLLKAGQDFYVGSVKALQGR